MYFRLAEILSMSPSAGLLREERTEENKHMKDDDLCFVFSPDEVVFLTDRVSIEEGDIVWFSLVKPCGGKALVDSIKKPVF